MNNNEKRLLAYALACEVEKMIINAKALPDIDLEYDKTYLKNYFLGVINDPVKYAQEDTYTRLNEGEIVKVLEGAMNK